MGKGRPRAVKEGVLGQNSTVSTSGSLIAPPGPVYYPTEDEFRDPLEYIYKIRPEAEPYGICRIVPPKSWSPPFALNADSFTFPTKTQAIHQLQVRPPGCDSKTFELEYNRFLEEHCGKKLKKKVVFDGEELDLCKLFNAVKRFGGYDNVTKDKKWGEVFRFFKSGKKISDCAKHVLCQLYREHLYDYENYSNWLNKEADRSCKNIVPADEKSEDKIEFSCPKRRRKNIRGEKVKVSHKAEKKEEELDQICEQCQSGLHGELMLLCDRCNKGWHIYCLSPPLKQVPPGNWYCLECLNSDKDSFGFVPGKHFSLDAFRRMADRAKKKWFGSGPRSHVQMEKKFWEIVEGLTGEVEVMYGSDLDTTVYGSGFPRASDQRPDSIEAKVWEEYRSSPWNLNNLPKSKGSMLQAVHHNITGVMVPWLYIGMLFSSFCWHFEDHCFYSMNYLHWGEPKCWYSIPGNEASAFEEVMRNSLPDLFDAQPDLLFQLVTMLNPSVLQKNGVPVYNVMQEPGNFVITFPRSYHAGFNFGLNCAEAVNFAPADWLPHGGFAAERYRLYHKSSVLSHEELLCVVAKGDHDSKVLPHLEEELLRIYTNEKTWREQLWKSGFVRSSSMSPRKYPAYLGTEEDPTCIICQQYLYLSAVVCRCRPSAFICLEHWEHLCECKSSKHRLLYRHSLAELYDLLLPVVKNSSEERPRSNNSRRRISFSSELCLLKKKVKSGNVTFGQLAEKWILRSCKISQNPYSADEYATLLKDAEQFLWAGYEMDPMREVVKNLIEAQNWAEGIRDCLSKIEKWSCHHDSDLERVKFEYVNKLLQFDPVPCNEPGRLKLKDWAQDARMLIQQVDDALSTSSNLSELEALCARACSLPIYVQESEKLSQKISSAKVWIDSVRKYVADKRPAAIAVDVLYKLNSEMKELEVNLPEAEMLLNLLRQAELCRVRCNEILNGLTSLQNVEGVLQEWNTFTINIPELALLKQYHFDALSWITRVNDVLENVHERKDQCNVIDELNCILKDGAYLRIQVDKLPLVEAELKKACCRQKALKAREIKGPLESMQQLMMEAVVLHIEGEQLFVDMSMILEKALHWEQRATGILAHGAQMSDFEDAIRNSEDIWVVLPSLDDVQDAVSLAKSWLENSKPFFGSAFSGIPTHSLPKIDSLKELVSQSFLLKISFEEPKLLERVLKNCEQWENDACSILLEADCLFDLSDIGSEISNGLRSKIECLITKLETITKAGLSLGLDFPQIPKLQNACSMLQYCSTTLSFCSVVPSLKEVENLLEAVEKFSVKWSACSLWVILVNGVKWLKKASEVVSFSSNFRKCKMSEAQELLAESQSISISFPMLVGLLVKAIEEHKLWQEQVNQFFSLESQERSWPQILQLKELGKAAAFNCSELDMILSEVEKVEKWKRRCLAILGPSVDDMNVLLGALQKIQQSMERSLYIYDKLREWTARKICFCYPCYQGDQEYLTCSSCEDCYHLHCLESTSIDADCAEVYKCTYCQVLEGGSTFQSGGSPLRFKGRRPELKVLIQLISDAESFCIRIEERDMLQQLMDQALLLKSFLAEIISFASSYRDKNLSIIRKKLSIAFKAIEMAGVYDHQDHCDLQMALARNSWRLRVNRLLEGIEKPTIKQIQQHLKEGVAMNIPPEDHFRQKLVELECIGLWWADRAKKVARDSGALVLDEVFELITEVENLPVHLDRELKWLRARTMLYCICRKPYDEMTMIACDQCNEWYHIACVKLHSPRKVYICGACRPQTGECVMLDHERSTDSISVEPKTPSPQHTKSRKRAKGVKSSLTQKMIAITNHSSPSGCSSGMDRLWWQNRKPFRRLAKKRTDFECLVPFYHRQ
ncbi:lysine-specific demethylase 5B isoform X2 [Tripterygium wilfordii]|uniref:Lysine-specific demethylase 5B isoform X2 n=1 Tax=Tripterygium wilfordii TaxID=458696 RepID=A0A7J7C7R9_TRIWF|nr:lysine-specific demethylase 5A isoform X2 [Tripterygium wilfordii]KAF5729995.1 lysine-specific demethylase 5B isoform X2 [Tripterygium wilfordii]